VTEEAKTPEHPAVKLADKLGETVARHVHASRTEGSAAETLRKYQATEAFARVVHDELKPALTDMMQPVFDAMPDDHPLAKLAGLTGSPDNPVVDAMLDVIVFGLAFLGAFKQVPPILAENLVNDVNARFPNVPLSPSQAANLWQEAYTGNIDLEQEALYGGIDADRWAALKYLSGVAPAPQELFELFRRGIIPQFATFDGELAVDTGLYQGQTKQPWVDTLAQLAYQWITYVDFVNAAVREQVDYDTAEQWAAKTGLDTTTEVAPGINMFDLLFDVAGRPPGPEEAARMAWRGIIPWKGSGPHETTFQQAIAESDLKTKWTDALQAVSAYVLTNGEITNMVRHGFIDKDDAPAYYALNGVPADLAALMIESALVDQLAEDRQLAKGEVLTMYQNGLMDRDSAAVALGVIGYHGDIGTELLDLTDFRRESQAYTRLVTEIGRQVVTRKITMSAANDSLAAMGVPAATVKIMLQDWAIALQSEVSDISASQVATAVYYGVESLGDGYNDLLALGYTPYDAWRLLSIRMHAPVNLPDGNPPRPTGNGVL
jgi:hypothetical protein